VLRILTSTVLALATGLGQTPKSAPPIETPHVSIVTSASPATATGRKVSLFVEVTPKPKMHLYAPGEKDGIPVGLTIEPSPGVTASAPSFPPPQKFFFAPLKLTQLVFSKPFRITQGVTIAASPAGALTIKGSFRYQACDDSVCYVPKTVPLEWTVPSR
jgi:DsbC/DsbD-like thiol-disulfide interchange protein